MKIGKIVSIVLIGLATNNAASAKQYSKQVAGKEVIVHSSPIPVILHRMVPPQHGRHVTEKEIQTGNLPVANTNAQTLSENVRLRVRRGR